MKDKATLLSERILRVVVGLMLADIHHGEAIEEVADCIREIMNESQSPTKRKRRKLFGRFRE